jgi:hypothetical protein
MREASYDCLCMTSVDDLVATLSSPSCQQLYSMTPAA